MEEEELIDPWMVLDRSEVTPGLKLRVHRENAGLSQEALGKKIGGLRGQDIADLEKGIRSIDPDLAQLLGSLMDDPPEYYLTKN